MAILDSGMGTELAYQRNKRGAGDKAVSQRSYNRVLGGPEQAEKAVENCWHAASPHPPHFKYEGEFRSWFLRVLIDEALALCRESQSVDAVGRDEMGESGPQSTH